MTQMFEVEEKEEIVSSDKAIDMFCTMMEVVASTPYNKSTAKILLETMPENLLMDFVTGLDTLKALTQSIQIERKRNTDEISKSQTVK